MMHAVMSGMFWGGLLMSVPPIILSVAVIVYLRREQTREAEAARESSAD